MHIALEQTSNDLIIGAKGGIERVVDGRFVVQQVRSKLITGLGEWLLDPSIGWLNFEDFEKNAQLYDFESRAREIILGTQGVLYIDTMSIRLTGRTVILEFTAQTVHGVIDLTIPWTNTGG